MFAVSLKRIAGARRLISTDVLQEAYLKELKSVKAVSFSDAIANAKGNVKPWAEPAKPSIPVFELNSNDVKAYVEEPVDTAAAPAASTDAATTEHLDEDWLVLDDPVEQSHH